MTLRSLLLVAWLACVGVAEAGQVWAVSVDGERLRRITQDDSRACGSPCWSPDGEQLAFDSWPVGRDLFSAKVSIVASDGGPMTVLGHGAMPSWSPDGDLIVFHTYATQPHAYAAKGKQQIAVMNADGSGREALLDGGISPRWSSRGDAIYLIRGSGLSRYDITEDRLTVLAAHLNAIRPGFNHHAAGDRFCATTWGSFGLLIVEPDGIETGWSARRRYGGSRL